MLITIIEWLQQPFGALPLMLLNLRILLFHWIGLTRLFQDLPVNFECIVSWQCLVYFNVGPGGQNVNKVNTKAEIRFVVEDADWIPSEVRKRLMEYQMNKINSNGELVVSSQQHRWFLDLFSATMLLIFVTCRTQSQNKEDCVKKLQEMLADAYLEPKERKMYEEISEQNKSHRRVEKRKRSEVKSNRRVNKDDY